MIIEIGIVIVSKGRAKGYEWIFWGDKNVLYVNLCDGQNTLLKINRSVDLRSVHFAVVNNTTISILVSI